MEYSWWCVALVFDYRWWIQCVQLNILNIKLPEYGKCKMSTWLEKYLTCVVPSGWSRVPGRLQPPSRHSNSSPWRWSPLHNCAAGTPLREAVWWAGTRRHTAAPTRRRTGRQSNLDTTWSSRELADGEAVGSMRRLSVAVCHLTSLPLSSAHGAIRHLHDASTLPGTPSL